VAVGQDQLPFKPLASTTEISRTRVFPEPLRPSRSPTEAENAALLQALLTHILAINVSYSSHIFLSCGQNDDELSVAKAIKIKIESINDYKFDCYVAVLVQDLRLPGCVTVVDLESVKASQVGLQAALEISEVASGRG
jgi:hypothetical protein